MTIGFEMKKPLQLWKSDNNMHDQAQQDQQRW